MLSRNLFTSTGDNLGTGFVPNGNGVDGTTIAGAQQPLPLHGAGIHEDRGPAVIEHEGFGSFGDTVAEPHAQCPVNADSEIPDGPLFVVAHIPSSPSSARAVSIMDGVISAMPRSFA